MRAASGARGSKGIRPDRYGLRAYVKVGNLQREKRFPFDTPLKTIHAWRDDTRVALRAARGVPVVAGTLEADIGRYLLLVRSMPTYAQRSDHLTLWLSALGAASARSTVTAERIATVLQDWRQTGLSAATCNKRRTALMHVWSKLDGRGARNPVRDVPKFPVAGALPRGRDPHVLDARLKLAPACRTRACCRVLLWTGMRPEELRRAEPDDLNLKQRTIIVRTAKGGRVRVVPLTIQAIEAWREFDQLDCWGHVPTEAPMNRLVKQWTKIPTLRLYDLRHSYGTALAGRQTRLDVIGALMGHSTLELTRRYTLAAVPPDAELATQKLAVAAGSRKKSRQTA